MIIFVTYFDSFLDAKEALLRAALVERSADDASLSIHRLVQAAVMTRLSAEEKIVFVDKVIHVLGKGFPDTWREDVGPQFKAWSRCEKCLPHVNFLVKQCSKYKLHPSDPEAFAEMILRCCWYLFFIGEPHIYILTDAQVPVRTRILRQSSRTDARRSPKLSKQR